MTNHKPRDTKQNADQHLDQSAATSDSTDTISNFETLWKAGQPVCIADCLPEDSQADTDLLVELACIDLQYRLQSGEDFRVETYVSEFPALADDELALLELVRTEWLFRRDKDHLQPDELTLRFPSLTSHIKVMFQMEVNQSGIAHSHQPTAEWICANCQHEIGSRSTGSTVCPKCEEPVVIGRYQLQQRVGEGAFGYVYRATDPKLDRDVALKLPRMQQFLVPEESERFLRESRNAAQLDHPGIVRIHDAGKHNETPFIVSEFVDGRTLHDRLKDQEFSFNAAATFAQHMAEAIAHAHERGVIHRDLKPANVMTVVNDAGEVIPRIMDFGLARRSLVDTSLTMDGHAVGTPAYMSPEQARGDNAEVDERADVYSLGVILFQLLCGELPFRGNAQKLIQQVINDDPPSPSRFKSRIPRDLETICLKCLNRDPRKRYQSAQHLVDELARWRDGKPIFARPISRFDRIWRWCKRYPAISGLSATLLASLTAGLLGVTSQWLRAENNANLYSAEAEQNRILADSETVARKKAEFEAENNIVINRFMNDILAQGQANRMGRDVKVLDALKAATERIDETFTGQPKVEATLRFTIGKLYRDYGSYRAIDQFRKSLALFLTTDGEESHVTLEAMDDLAGALRSLGDTEEEVLEARTLRERVLAIRRKLHRPGHEEILIAMNNLAVVYNDLDEHQRSIELYRAIQKARANDAPDAHYQLTQHNIALAYCGLREFEKAESIFRQLLSSFDQLPDFKFNREYYNTIGSFATCLRSLNKYPESEKYYREAITGRTQLLGANHRHTLRSHRSFAKLLIETGNFEKALEAIEASLSLHVEDPGPARGYTVDVRHQKFDVLVALERFDEAEKFMKSSWELVRQDRGADHKYAKGLEDRLLEFYQSRGKTTKTPKGTK